MSTLVRSPEPVYAPLLGMILHSNFDFRILATPDDVNQCEIYYPIGAPEEGSKIEFAPVFTGKGSDQRYIRSNVKITYLDMEAQKFPDDPVPHVEANRFYGQIQSKNVHASILCGSGAMTLINLTYAFWYEFLPTRGMRFTHQLTGKVIQPDWITFLDEGWDQYIRKIQDRSLQPLVKGNLFSI